MDDIELTRQLTDHENQIKSLKHRMDGVEDVIKEIGKLATSVQLLAAEAKSTGEKVDKLSDKVDSMEKKPGEKAEKLRDTIVQDIVKIVVSALFGAALALILK